ncbi:hypothetical protein J1614_010714 [Plenodomus biglobosus]|nr:hypothetical protein J1614_010714 [Plenodomus biglobosus]
MPLPSLSYEQPPVLLLCLSFIPLQLGTAPTNATKAAKFPISLAFTEHRPRCTNLRLLARQPRDDDNAKPTIRICPCWSEEEKRRKARI